MVFWCYICQPQAAEFFTLCVAENWSESEARGHYRKNYLKIVITLSPPEGHGHVWPEI